MTNAVNQIANELRAECARIIKRNFGLPNALCAVKLETVEQVSAYIDAAEDRLSRCTCQEHAGFTINTARIDATPYRLLEAAAVERMQGGAA